VAEKFKLDGTEVYLVNPTVPDDTSLENSHDYQYFPCSVYLTTRRLVVCKHSWKRTIIRESAILHGSSEAKTLVFSIPIAGIKGIKYSIEEKKGPFGGSYTSRKLIFPAGMVDKEEIHIVYNHRNQRVVQIFDAMSEYWGDTKHWSDYNKYEEQTQLKKQGLTWDQINEQIQPKYMRIYLEDVHNWKEYLIEIYSNNWNKSQEWKDNEVKRVQSLFPLLPKGTDIDYMSVKQIEHLASQSQAQVPQSEKIIPLANPASNRADLSHQLSRLAKLKVEGHLSDEEFEAAKAKLLDS
jgi:hypothetical protein